MNRFVCSHLNNKHYLVSTVLECKDLFLSETYGQNLKTQCFHFISCLTFTMRLRLDSESRFSGFSPLQPCHRPLDCQCFARSLVVARGAPTPLVGCVCIFLLIGFGLGEGVEVRCHPRLPRAGVHAVWPPAEAVSAPPCEAPWAALGRGAAPSEVGQLRKLLDTCTQERFNSFPPLIYSVISITGLKSICLLVYAVYCGGN